MPSVCFWRIVELTDTELTELPALKEDFLHPEGPGWNGLFWEGRSSPSLMGPQGVKAS